MKKYFFATLVSGIMATLFFIGCNKTSNNEFVSDFVIEKNEPFTITKENGVTVTASDVYSRKSTFRREISINAGKGKGKLPKIFITFISSDNYNIYEKMKRSPGSVNGLLTIETEGQVILKRRVIDGVFQKTEIIAYRVPGLVYNPNVACTVSTIHDCVSWEIEDMNWVEYSFCLAGAPACYAGLWASCTWEVCNNHMQYTNPIN